MDGFGKVLIIIGIGAICAFGSIIVKFSWEERSEQFNQDRQDAVNAGAGEWYWDAEGNKLFRLLEKNKYMEKK